MGRQMVSYVIVNTSTLISASSLANEDFLPISTNITFEPLQTVVLLPLTIFNDGIEEGAEQFTIRLLSYEEEIRIRGDLLITINDGRGKKLSVTCVM